MSSIGTSRQNKIEQACSAAEEFSKLYYNCIDKSRHKISKFYLDDATLVWNGNGVHGKDGITKFYEGLPLSVTELESVDSQPLLDGALQGQMSILVLTAGQMKFQGKPKTPFQQNFMLTVQSDVWKVVSDCFRFQETL